MIAEAPHFMSTQKDFVNSVWNMILFNILILTNLTFDWFLISFLLN